MTGNIKTVGVIGLGVMGFEIAFLYAMKGYRTAAYDSAPAAIDSLSRRKQQTIERLKRRNRLSDQEIQNVETNLLPAQKIDALSGVDLITEAIAENAGAKVQLYRELQDARFAGILTTNTSSLPQKDLLGAGAFDRARFATTHFFNPVLYTQMVEVVRGGMEATAFSATRDFLQSLERTAVETRDISGFVSNSILMFYAIMALRLLEVGAGIEQIDQVAREMKALPPFVSFDSWRPSIVEDVTRIMDEVRDEPFLRSSRLLPPLAAENPRFYLDGKPNEAILQKVSKSAGNPDNQNIRLALETAVGVAAARLVELGESPAVVDFICIEGLKLPVPPLSELDRSGASAKIRKVAQVNKLLGREPLSVPALLTRMARVNETFFKNGPPNPWLSSNPGN